MRLLIVSEWQCYFEYILTSESQGVHDIDQHWSIDHERSKLMQGVNQCQKVSPFDAQLRDGLRYLYPSSAIGIC